MEPDPDPVTEEAMLPFSKGKGKGRKGRKGKAKGGQGKNKKGKGKKGKNGKCKRGKGKGKSGKCKKKKDKGKGKSKGKGKGKGKGYHGSSDDWSKGKGSKGKGGKGKGNNGVAPPDPDPWPPVTPNPTPAPVTPATNPAVTPMPTPATPMPTPAAVTPPPSTNVIITTTPPVSPVSEVDCNGIANGSASTQNPFDTLNVDMDLLIQNGFDVDSVLSVFQEELQKDVATSMSGCGPPQSGRKLSVRITNVVFRRPELASGSCPVPENFDDAACYPTDTLVDVYFENEETRVRVLLEREDFDELLENEIQEAIDNGDLQVPGLLDVAGVDATRQDDTSGLQQEDNSSSSSNFDGLGAGGIVAAAGAAFVLVLLLICAITKRRRHRSVSSSFYPLAEEEDKTYYDEEVEVIGDEDGASIASVWTGRKRDSEYDLSNVLGFPYLGSQLGLAASHSNVHRCSSATCAICEAQRKNDVTFVSTGTLQTPSKRTRDSDRHYLSNDSIIL